MIVFPSHVKNYHVRQGFAVTRYNDVQFAKPLAPLLRPLTFPTPLLIRGKDDTWIFMVGGDLNGSVSKYCFKNDEW
jgi:hypothetical protein